MGQCSLRYREKEFPLTGFQSIWQYALGVIVSFVLPVIVSAQETEGYTTPWLPQNVFEGSRSIDSMFNIILYLTMATLIGVLITMAVFLYRYRHRQGRRAIYTHGNPRLEAVWTLIPTVIMILIVAFSQSTWDELKNPQRMPQGEDVVKVHVWGRQFNWFFHYPGQDGKHGKTDYVWRQNTGDPAQEIGLKRGYVEDFLDPEQIEMFESDPQNVDVIEPDPAAFDDVVTSVMYIPVNKKVHIQISSIDVLHSFFVPQFRVKQDAVPGLSGHIWLEASKTSAEVVGQFSPGEPKPFDIICAELCGQGHYKMRGQMFVVSDDDYKSWLADNAPEEGEFEDEYDDEEYDEGDEEE
ncbi:MAG: hypothetical protein CMJ20_12865 [Phycisphaeraceae bacterium]|nr:hypothetical protein [Phycisphaeraceae bacterium]